MIDSRLVNTKCEKCIHRRYDPLSAAPPYPCDICIHRPNRNNDKSEYTDDFEGEQDRAEYDLSAIPGTKYDF